MSEETKDQAIPNQTYDIVDDEATITVEVPGAVFIRLNQLLTSGLKNKDMAELTASVNRVKDKEPEEQNSLDYHVETILVLNGIISKAAKDQKKLKPFTFTMPKQEAKTD